MSKLKKAHKTTKFSSDLESLKLYHFGFNINNQFLSAPKNENTLK